MIFFPDHTLSVHFMWKTIHICSVKTICLQASENASIWLIRNCLKMLIHMRVFNPNAFSFLLSLTIYISTNINIIVLNQHGILSVSIWICPWSNLSLRYTDIEASFLCMFWFKNYIHKTMLINVDGVCKRLTTWMCTQALFSSIFCNCKK